MSENVETITAGHRSGDNTPGPSPALAAKKATGIQVGALAPIFLFLILALGAVFRFGGLDWDGNHHLHPDERFLTDVASLLSSVDSPLDYLRTSDSTLNPYNFGRSFYVYGNLPMTVTRYAAEWAAVACELVTTFRQQQPDWCGYTYTAYDGIHLVGRALSGLVDLVGIAFAFLIGRRLYNWKAGVITALLLSLAVMPIQQSHFFTMDNWAAMFTTAALYAAVRAATIGDEEPRWRLGWFVLFGVALGLAAASRINVALLALIVNVSVVIWLARRSHTWSSLWRPEGAGDLQRAVVSIFAAAVVFVIVFRIAQPYAFTDAELARQIALAETGEEPGLAGLMLRSLIGLNPQFLANMAEIQRLQAPEALFPPALQWVDRTPILFPWTNMVLYGLGLTAGLLATFAVLWALWRSLNRANRWGAYPEWMVHAIPLSWTLLYFLFTATRWVKSIRYLLPIYPSALVLAGWALVYLWQRASEAGERQRLYQAAVAALAAVVVVPSFLWALSFTQIYREPVTRVAASEWIFENVPSGATLLYMTADGQPREMQLPLKEFRFDGLGAPLQLNAEMPEDGIVTGLRFNYLSDPAEDGIADDAETIRLSLGNAAPVDRVLSLGQSRQPVVVDLPATAFSAGEPIRLLAESGPGGTFTAGTSRLVNEHWDDLLPVSLSGRSAYGAYYTEVTGGQRPVTHPDSPEKLEEMLIWLDEADYVMLSSQRAMWHLPRLPMTYPLMMQYYDGLFNGQLGFDLVAEFHGNLRLGPLYISDTAARLGWNEPPEVGWPPPGELAAEEAFSVYDHPPVWIFAKTDRYSAAAARDLLSSADLTQVTVMNPLEATQAPGGLMLDEEAAAAQAAGGSFSEVFNVDGLLSSNPWLAALVWFVVLFLLGWLVFPLASVALGGLPDQGYGLSRVLGLLLLSYIPWLLASLGWLPHTRGTILLALALIAVAGIVAFVARRAEIMRFWRGNRGYVALVELLGLGLFVLMIAIRLGNPDVWDVIWGGEKPMDLSYFTAVLKSTSFPPYDPWFAGGYINYYYYGFVFAGVLAELLGVVPAVAYNLILPMLFSLTGLGVFSLAYNLVVARQREAAAGADIRVAAQSSVWSELVAQVRQRATVAGLVAVALALLVGNLAQVGVVGNAWYQAGSASLDEIPVIGRVARTIDGGVRVLSGEPAPIYPGDWFWTASRAINAEPGEAGPITEFPFFTFLYGDLHAHMISMPLMMLALGWAVSLALMATRVPPTRSRGRAALQAAVIWLIGALSIGVLRATNTWDWPTYLLLGAVAVVYYVFRREGAFTLWAAGRALVLVVLLGGLSTLAFWPYAANYGTGYSSVSLWPGSYTRATNFLVIYGLFLFIVVTWLVVEFRTWAKGWTAVSLQRWRPYAPVTLVAALLLALIAAIMLVRGYWIAPIVLPLLVASGLLALRPGLETARRVALALIAAALGLTLLVEIVVLDGDIGRMNTVFKFYLQVWLLLSVACGPAAVWAWQSVRQTKRLRLAWEVGLAILVFAALLYPLTATPAKWGIRMNPDAPNTLDGMAFMPYVEYGDTDYAGSPRTVRLADDYEAIRWAQRNIEGSPIMMEAHGSNPYRSIASRVAMYTGLPTIVGWDWHQRQQRAVTPGELVTRRIGDVNTFYNTADITVANELLDKYGVSYVFVGSLENTYYSPQGLAKFEEMAGSGDLVEVYRDESARIYEVAH